MKWYYEAGGQQQGPVSDDELERLLSTGRIRPETLIWREGMSDWQPLRQARPPEPAPAAVQSESEGDRSEQARCANCARWFPLSEMVQFSGTPICPDCKPAVLLSLQQGAGLPTGLEIERTGPAWEQRRELGYGPAAWETIKATLFRPSLTFASMKRDGGLETPFLFYVPIGTVGTLCNVVLQWQGLHRLPPKGVPPAMLQIMHALESYPALIGGCIAAPFLASLVIFLYAGVMHLGLRLCGGARYPFETTFRTSCYTYGSAMAVQLIPQLCLLLASLLGPTVAAAGGTLIQCLSGVVGIWAIVVLCLGLARAHEVPTIKAVFAFFLPMLLACGLGFVAVFLAIAAAASRGMH